MDDALAGNDQRAGVARALWITAKRRCELRTEPLRAPAEGEVVVESLFGAISRGTEALVFGAEVPAGEAERMRGPHQDGDFPFPVKYGYAVVGRVVEGPRSGETVFCLHPHQDRFVVSVEELTAVPPGVPPERAVLGANMETALNILWDAGAAPGDRVAVIGGGLVGLLTASLAARLPGTEVTLVDVDPARADLAKHLGLSFAAPGEAAPEQDIVVNASASGDGLCEAIRIAGDEARIVEASWYGARPVQLPLGGAFHSRRLSIVASQVGAVPPMRRARWTNARRLAKALELIDDPRLDLLFTGETPFAELPERYADILAASGTLCHRIRY